MEIDKLYKLYVKNKTICTDTRSLVKGSLFFALKGLNFNGNTFAKKAIRNGASYVIIDQKEYHEDNKQFILVKDTLETLQKLARYHRRTLDIPIITITGTNGKTTSKELINEVLKQKYNCTATKGNLNNHIGVPLTLLEITNNTDIAIIEIGANHIGEIKFLCEIAEPTHGVITNIGKAHLEGFGSFEDIIKTKNELYSYLNQNNGICFVNREDKVLMKLNPQRVIFYSSKGDYHIEHEKKNGFTNLIYQGNRFNSKLIGSYQAYNISLAICIGNYFKIEIKDIQQAIQNYKPNNNRSQLIETTDNLIISDAYNANPTSMMLMLESFIKQNHNNKICILGDMLELGETSKQEHDAIKLFVKDNKLQVLFVGKHFYSKDEDFSFKTKKDLKKYLHENPIKNHLILLKGSRGISLETLINML